MSRTVIISCALAAACMLTPWHASAQPSCGWSDAPAGAVDDAVNAMIVFDDDSGPALYAAGDFVALAGESMRHIARWDGSAWSPVGAGLDAGVLDLAVFDPGDGPRLIASGRSNLVGSSTLAMWDGVAWAEVPGTPHVWTGGMGVSSVGGRPELYVSMPVSGYIMRWDGTSWRPVGNGLFTVAFDLTEYDAGLGPELFAAGGLAALYRYDGVDWAPVDGDFSIDHLVWSLQPFDDGSGESLYLGGEFTRVRTSMSALRVARWDGQSWGQVGDGFDGAAFSLAVFDDGSGPALYAGGAFTHSGATPVGHVARWDGVAWQPLGEGTDGMVTALASGEGAAGLPDALYVGGTFSSAGGLSSPSFAAWLSCSCPADFNGDGTVNTLDVLAFLNAWNAGDPSADFNGDGTVNTLDVLAFLNAWNAGCA